MSKKLIGAACAAAGLLLSGSAARAAEGVASDGSAQRSTKKSLLRLRATLPSEMGTGKGPDGKPTKAPMDTALGSLVVSRFTKEFETPRFRYFEVKSVSELKEGVTVGDVAKWVDENKVRWACEEEAFLRAAQSLEGAEPADCGDPKVREEIKLERAQIDGQFRGVFAYQLNVDSFDREPCKPVEVTRIVNGKAVKEMQQKCGVAADATVDVWRFDFKGYPAESYPFAKIATLKMPLIAKYVFALGSNAATDPSSAVAYETAANETGEGLAHALSVEMRKLDPFRLRSPVNDARLGKGMSGPLEIDVGKNEGVRVGYGFDVMQTGIDGKGSRVGYVKVTKVGDNRLDAEGQKARKEGKPRLSTSDVISNAGIVAGTQISEHPLLGLNLRPYFQFALPGYDVAGTKAGAGSGGGLEFEYDLSSKINKVPELWTGLRIGYESAALGASSVGALQLELHARKLFYVRRLQLGVDVAGGYMSIALPGDASAGYTTGSLGGSAALSAGVFVIPELQLGASAGFRFYGRPTKATKKDAPDIVLPDAINLNPTGFTSNVWVAVAF